MRLQRMLGHATTLLSEHPDNIVVIGCGAGVTAGAVSIDPRLKHETIAEIERLVHGRSTSTSGPELQRRRNKKVECTSTTRGISS